MATSQSQSNKVYLEAIAGLASQSQSQKVYLEVITAFASQSQSQKVYLEVICDPPSATGVTVPVMFICT